MLACGLFFLFTTYLGFVTPDYSMVTQTVSEIGRVGSALELEYQLYMYVVCITLMLFCYALFKHANAHKISTLPAYLVLIFTLSEVAMFSYPTPHELHNVFGSLSMFGWFFPLVVAIAWRKSQHWAWLKPLCYALFIVNLASIYWMLSPINLPVDNPLAGIAQRFSFFMLYLSFSLVGFSVYKTDQS